MTTYLSNAISNATSIEQVAEYVNDGTCEGMEGIEFTPAMLAGQYAWQASKDADPDWIDEQTLEAHLDFLRDAGGQFDESEAIAHGMKIAAADSE